MNRLSEGPAMRCYNKNRFNQQSSNWREATSNASHLDLHIWIWRCLQAQRTVGFTITQEHNRTFVIASTRDPSRHATCDRSLCHMRCRLTEREHPKHWPVVVFSLHFEPMDINWFSEGLASPTRIDYIQHRFKLREDNAAQLLFSSD